LALSSSEYIKHEFKAAAAAQQQADLMIISNHYAYMHIFTLIIGLLSCWLQVKLKHIQSITSNNLSSITNAKQAKITHLTQIRRIRQGFGISNHSRSEHNLF
jgi:hypothetical protein